jgi:hypothetical protein
MAKTRETLESWAEEFLRELKPRTPEELQNRDKLDIRPLTTTDLVRDDRKEH